MDTYEQTNRMVEPIERMLERLSVDAVFGKPIKEGDVTVIPVTEIGVGFGYGYGFGRGPSGTAEGDQETAGTGEGVGAGGGAGGRVTPRGFIRITPDRVQFEPLLDVTRMGLAGIAMTAWSVFWIAKTIRAFAKASVKKER
jgi:uncharacterized spore protein YtfJ